MDILTLLVIISQLIFVAFFMAALASFTLDKAFPNTAFGYKPFDPSYPIGVPVPPSNS